MWYPYLINMSMCPFVLYPYLRRASKYTHMYVARSCNKKKRCDYYINDGSFSYIRVRRICGNNKYVYVPCCLVRISKMCVYIHSYVCVTLMEYGYVITTSMCVCVYVCVCM